MGGPIRDIGTLEIIGTLVKSVLGLLLHQLHTVVQRVVQLRKKGMLVWQKFIVRLVDGVVGQMDIRPMLRDGRIHVNSEVRGTAIVEILVPCECSGRIRELEVLRDIQHGEEMDVPH